MVSTSREHTLRLKLPCGQTLGLALILFGLLMVFGEVMVRTEIFQTHVVANRKGGRHRQFELQLGRLETVVARDGPIDCFFLGNSMVWHDFDPVAFAQAYRSQTGQEIRCFNFGIDGLPTVTAGALAQILVGDYQPRLLIYGMTARDLALTREYKNEVPILQMPWLRYRLGQFSIQGWFYDHSRLYQYWETLGHLLRLEKRYLLLTGSYASLKENYGFYGHKAVGTFVGIPPDPQSEDRQIRGLFELLSRYELLPENLSGLEQVMAQDAKGVQVLIVEMPVPPTYFQFFGNGRQDYQRFIDRVEKIAESMTVPFWETTRMRLIPDDGWFDYCYLNTTGARVFSAWLGEQLGSAVVERKLENLLLRVEKAHSLELQ